MGTFGVAGKCRVQPLAGTPRAFVIEPLEADAARLVVTGFDGDTLPPALHEVEIGLTAAGGGIYDGLLRSREGEFTFQVRGVERLEPRPGLFNPLLAGFSLRSRDRWVVRGLLSLLRWPGGAWLLRTWHVRRR